MSGLISRLCRMRFLEGDEIRLGLCFWTVLVGLETSSSAELLCRACRGPSLCIYTLLVSPDLTFEVYLHLHRTEQHTHLKIYHLTILKSYSSYSLTTAPEKHPKCPPKSPGQAPTKPPPPTPTQPTNSPPSPPTPASQPRPQPRHPPSPPTKKSHQQPSPPSTHHTPPPRPSNPRRSSA